MPVKSTTTTAPKEKTYTRAQIEKVCSQTRTRLLEEMADSPFLAPMDLACKLFLKYVKEELK